MYTQSRIYFCQRKALDLHKNTEFSLFLRIEFWKIWYFELLSWLIYKCTEMPVSRRPKISIIMLQNTEMSKGRSRISELKNKIIMLLPFPSSKEEMQGFKGVVLGLFFLCFPGKNRSRTTCMCKQVVPDSFIVYKIKRHLFLSNGPVHSNAWGSLSRSFSQCMKNKKNLTL